MSRRFFETYVEQQLAPTFRRDDVIVLGNLAADKSPGRNRPPRQQAHVYCCCRHACTSVLKLFSIQSARHKVPPGLKRSTGNAGVSRSRRSRPIAGASACVSAPFST